MPFSAHEGRVNARNEPLILVSYVACLDAGAIVTLRYRVFDIMYCASS